MLPVAVFRCPSVDVSGLLLLRENRMNGRNNNSRTVDEDGPQQSGGSMLAELRGWLSFVGIIVLGLIQFGGGLSHVTAQASESDQNTKDIAKHGADILMVQGDVQKLQSDAKDMKVTADRINGIMFEDHGRLIKIETTVNGIEKIVELAVARQPNGIK